MYVNVNIGVLTCKQAEFSARTGAVVEQLSTGDRYKYLDGRLYLWDEICKEWIPDWPENLTLLAFDCIGSVRWRAIYDVEID